MSTKTSKIFIEDGDIQIHIYKEMHDSCDSCFHLELRRLHGGSETNEETNIVLPSGIAKELIRLLKPYEK